MDTGKDIERGSTTDIHGNTVIIPTFQHENWGDDRHTVDTIEDLTLLVRAMGWKSLKGFTHETQTEADELLGRWWVVMGGEDGLRIFVMEKNDGSEACDVGDDTSEIWK